MRWWWRYGLYTNRISPRGGIDPRYNTAVLPISLPLNCTLRPLSFPQYQYDAHSPPPNTPAPTGARVVRPSRETLTFYE